jgi:uridine kinase
LALDVAERWRTPESVCSQYQATLWPGTDAYIWPAERFADLVASGQQPREASPTVVIKTIRKQLG